MRHLSVPSAQTQRWLELCRSNHWSTNQAGITRLEDGRNAIPLNQNAPESTDPCWEGNPQIELEVEKKRPVHWLDHLDRQLVEQHQQHWPRSYEVQGDVLIVKIEQDVWDFGELIADAMLTQLPNIRLVCADLGVKGEFRLRDLLPLASRDGSLHTRTRIRENGYMLWVDPSKVYFSARLSNERIETLTSAQNLRQELGRPLVVCDPYAGVGPSMGALLSEADLVGGYLVGDLNPDATELLQTNIDALVSRRKSTGTAALAPTSVICQDARRWAEREGNVGVADMLLVNLPHDSIAHLPSLLPLLRRDQTVVVKGWAIVQNTEQNSVEQAIRQAVIGQNGDVIHLALREVKGFSMTKRFMSFEARCSFVSER
tara:strand:+ start:5329 stop:6444 length:1116 start_codon:yes stop_codon:yes gene_type:complete